jgi:flavin-dependent dehydrogenase
VDVAIVGAGPAGSTLAVRLAREGLRVLLVDRAAFPRPKPCGEFISPECLPLLEEIGVAHGLREAGAHPVRGMALRGFGQQAEGRYGRRRPYAPGVAAHGFGLRREVFDALLLEHAGATPGVEVEEGFRVVELVRSPESGAVDGVEGVDRSGRRRRIAARFVVGADGLRSRVAARLGARRRRRWLRKIAMTTRFEGVAPRDGGELHVFPGGYFAACTVDRDLFSVNLVVDAARVRGGRDGLEALFEERVRSVPTVRRRLHDARRVDPVTACGPFGTVTSRRTFDGAALVGDAAGYVDPMTGEGISYALIGSARLARHLVPALDRGDESAASLRGYEADYRRELKPRHRTSLLLQAGMRSPALTRGVVMSLRAIPGLFDRIVESTGGAGWIKEPAVRTR